jgi:hypothetical protein
MEARLGEIRRERKGEAEADAQQKSFTCAHTSLVNPTRSAALPAPGRPIRLRRAPVGRGLQLPELVDQFVHRIVDDDQA